MAPLYASDSMIGNAGGLRITPSIVLGWVRANPLPFFEPVYIVSGILGRIGVIINGSIGHIGKGNQSTSSRLAEESHFLVLSRLSLMKAN